MGKVLLDDLREVLDYNPISALRLPRPQGLRTRLHLGGVKYNATL